MKRMFATLCAAAALTGSAAAAEIEVTIVNMTGYSYFTPLLVAAHPHDVRMFTEGEAASTSLQAMAEGGDISGLNDEFTAVGASTAQNPAGGLLAPGVKTTAVVQSGTGNDSLSVAAMILPTNDGFVALNGWKIPSRPGTYTFTLNAYDAGTEANDEIVNGGGAPGVPGIPADPGGIAGSGATGAAAFAEGHVHIHRGILGDTNATGGISDLDSRYHRWINPVAEVTVTVRPGRFHAPMFQNAHKTGK
jgi:hypothetical protein